MLTTPSEIDDSTNGPPTIIICQMIVSYFSKEVRMSTSEPPFSTILVYPWIVAEAFNYLNFLSGSPIIVVPIVNKLVLSQATL